MIDLEGAVSSAISLIGGFHIGVKALLDVNLIWFGYIARLSQLGGGGYLHVQIISTCRRGLKGRGEGVGTLWFYHSPTPDSLFPSRRDVLVKCILCK